MRDWLTTEHNGIPNWLTALAVGACALAAGVAIGGVVYLALLWWGVAMNEPFHEDDIFLAACVVLIAALVILCASAR